MLVVSKFLLVAILLVSARVADTDRAETRDQDRARGGGFVRVSSLNPLCGFVTPNTCLPSPGCVALGWIETKNTRVLRETGP